MNLMKRHLIGVEDLRTIIDITFIA
jgi:hypothetical protein